MRDQRPEANEPAGIPLTFHSPPLLANRMAPA
jgi:hypothetical protein